MKEKLVRDVFYEPNNNKKTIWRYMSYEKFISLIKDGLYFCRLDRLVDNDPNEGSFAQVNMKITKNKNSSIQDSLKNLEFFSKEIKKTIFVNCWHINDNELKNMWDKYANDAKAICIKTTFEKLKKSFIDRQPIFSEVKYLDYSKDMIPKTNLLYIVIHKDKEFIDENELRLWFQDITSFNNSNGIYHNDKTGISVKIDLEAMIFSAQINSPLYAQINGPFHSQSFLAIIIL